ncbi:hypothetical protein OHT93_37105 [Streptomyces sp. NBC_00191]|uniref:hypothetical protein n=1 Tax=Streptomyces sp. NBC_00191 TaxID=2975674 RepID=UPI0032470EEF
MSVLKDRGDRVERPGTAGFVPWLMTLVALTSLALTAVWLGGSLGVALVGGGTEALWPGAPKGAVVAGVSALAGVLFAAAALCFFTVDGALAAMATRRSADNGSAHVGEHTRAPVPARGSDARAAPPSPPE